MKFIQAIQIKLHHSSLSRCPNFNSAITCQVLLKNKYLKSTLVSIGTQEMLQNVLVGSWAYFRLDTKQWTNIVDYVPPPIIINATTLHSFKIVLRLWLFLSLVHIFLLHFFLPFNFLLTCFGAATCDSLGLTLKSVVFRMTEQARISFFLNVSFLFLLPIYYYCFPNKHDFWASSPI